MSRRSILVVACGLAIGACSSGSNEPGAAGDAAAEWQTLFDGTSLAGWTQVQEANWQLGDGTVRADSGSGFLLSTGVYDDFDLELEFFVSPDANSGVFIRCANPAEIGAATCYEVNIFDQRPDPTYRTGGIVNVAPPAVNLDTGDRWNKFEISAHGQHLVVRLNGEMMVDTTDDKFAAGPFALQYGAGSVMFRNVRIRTN
jgi:hypothetical protein